MQYILELINSLTENSQLSHMLFIGITAAATFACALSIGYITSAYTDPVKRRLTSILEDHHVIDKHQESRDDFTRKIMGSAASALFPSNEKETGKIRSRLIIAGFRSSNAITNFYATKAILSVALPIIVLLASQLSANIESSKVIFLCMLSLSLGLIGPNYVLTKLVKRRQKKLRAAFPDALDLLVICVEAGLGLTNAIARVAREMDVAHPELSADLALINKEIMVGVPRDEALKNLSTRTGLDEIKGLSALLDQSIRFGTSIAEALRIYAEEFRDKRMQLAEEKAAKISTKLIFPLTFFMWPAFFVVAIGPAALKLMEAMSGKS